MLKSGAGIYEINAIRRHISAMNGGMLAKRISERGAELIGFGISDAVGTPATGDTGVLVWIIALPVTILAAAFVLKRKEREA